MKKKDLFVIVTVLAVAAALLLYGLSMRKAGEKTEPPEATSITEIGDVEEKTTGMTDAGYSDQVREAAKAYLKEFPAESYLLVTTNNNTYSPIPLNEENAFRLTQADGSENVVHIGKNSFYMESSNCDNQNCVDEGEVTLDNRDSRILFNMVICLPHQLSLELLTPAEAEERLLELYAGQESYQAAMEAYQAEHPEETGAAEAQAEGEYEDK